MCLIDSILMSGATITFARHDKNYTDIRVNKNNWSGTNWIYEWYKSFGIVFDEVHAWEPLEAQRGVASGTGLRQGVKKPTSLRKGKRISKLRERNMKGKSRDQFAAGHRALDEIDGANVEANIDESFYPDGVLHFYNVGVTDVRESQHNPLYLISQICKPEDFVVFKLDIDSKFEINLVNQLLRNTDIMNLVDEFYYEHHVKNDVMRMHGLGKGTNRKYTLAAWYDMVTGARKKGFRMHFWP